MRSEQFGGKAAQELLLYTRVVFMKIHSSRKQILVQNVIYTVRMSKIHTCEKLGCMSHQICRVKSVGSSIDLKFLRALALILTDFTLNAVDLEKNVKLKCFHSLNRTDNDNYQWCIYLSLI